MASHSKSNKTLAVRRRCCRKDNGYSPEAVSRVGGNKKLPCRSATAELLTDWQFLEAKAEADPNFREQESKEPPTASPESKP